ncbi:MAG: J domain-containing protein [Chakrabartia godavariana]
MMRFLLFVAIIGIIIWIGKGALQPSGALSRGEAAKLLGIDPDADTETVLEAHKRLIAKVHPDAGGSADLAARVNQARDVLLGRLRG